MVNGDDRVRSAKFSRPGETGRQNQARSRCRRSSSSRPARSTSSLGTAQYRRELYSRDRQKARRRKELIDNNDRKIDDSLSMCLSAGEDGAEELICLLAEIRDAVEADNLYGWMVQHSVNLQVACGEIVAITFEEKQREFMDAKASSGASS